MTLKSVVSSMKYRKTSLWILEVWKEEVKEFGICLFKINKKNKNTLCEICPKSRGKAPDQMCETQFLHISIILTSLHSFNLLFPLIVSVQQLYLSFHLYSLHFPHLLPDSSHTHGDSPHSQYSSHSPHSVPQFFILVFTDSLLGL